MSIIGMAPLEIMNTSTMHNDEAFLTLLSSQRELLNRLNMESALARDQQSVTQRPSIKRGSLIGAIDPLSLMNTPIIERRSSLDMLFSRRLSMGAGSETFAIPPASSNEMEEGKIKDYDFGDFRNQKAKRRRSSFDMLSAALYEEQQQQSRRMSLLSTFSRPTDVDDTFEDDLLALDHSNLKSQRVRLDPSITAEKLKSNLEAFSGSMQKSTKSQQDIHDWDRKMGLKRSHSKTMRQTMRSRKKLRTMLKKDINIISGSR